MRKRNNEIEMYSLRLPFSFAPFRGVDDDDNSVGVFAIGAILQTFVLKLFCFRLKSDFDLLID